MFVKAQVTMLFAVFASAQTWTVQPVATTASLRGIHAVNGKIAWASGTAGTVLRTVDAGVHWSVMNVPGADELDFRDVHAVDKRTAYVLSSGTGVKSKIYKTTDAGSHWNLLFTNEDAKGFFDAFAFWDAKHGVLVGDPVGGHFVILTTKDGGATWIKRNTPAALEGEGAFAASGTCIAVRGAKEVWFATGGARVFHSLDGGENWTVAPTPIRHDGAAAGIFSLAFSNDGHGVAVGGDYSKPSESQGNVAVTADWGASWTEPAGRPDGFRSAVEYVAKEKAWIAVGTGGSDISRDGGSSWVRVDSGVYNAVSYPWAVGPKGQMARWGGGKNAGRR